MQKSIAFQTLGEVNNKSGWPSGLRRQTQEINSSLLGGEHSGPRMRAWVRIPLLTIILYPFSFILIFTAILNLLLLYSLAQDFKIYMQDRQWCGFFTRTSTAKYYVVHTSCYKGAFNNYVDKMRGDRRGSKKGLFLSTLRAKLYTPSTLNMDFIQWHTQLNVCAVK